MKDMRVIREKLGDNKGFTLIEMAIVLIIIGIIIGAVVKGKDVIKSAEQKRLYSTFVREWQVAYNNYYDRTGWILGDEDTADNNQGGRDGQCSLATVANLNSQLTAAGLNPPAEGPTGTTNQRTYTDSFGRQSTLTLQFAYDTTNGNHIRITGSPGIPFDLGLAWDKIIDGSADGQNGDLLFDANTAGPAVDPWPSADSDLTANDGVLLKMEF